MTLHVAGQSNGHRGKYTAMKTGEFGKVTGIVLILAVVAAIGGQIGLGARFDWEGRPVPEILLMYHDGGTLLAVIWTVFAAGSLMLVPSALLLHKVFCRKATPYLYVGTAFGVIAGLAYVVGIARWMLLAKMLSGLYVDPRTGEATRRAVEVVFQAANAYLGNTFGETIAPVAHAVWLVFLGHAMFKSKTCGPWLSLAQVAAGIVIACRPLEYVGWRAMASVSDKGLMLWAVSMLVLAACLLSGRPWANEGRAHH
jgi:hypothetical protein